ncbi:MAG: hypothetical protein H0U61_00270 [Nocardioidaceae bacterium]|nr:hypothetical protein [Nocardioidaceae bacterium]
MRRPVHLRVSCLVASILLAGCGLASSKDNLDLSKRATTLAAADSVIDRYNRIRSQADAAVDAGLLVDVEGGPLLAVDRGAFYLRQRLAVSTKPVHFGHTRLLVAANFDAYPLWFATVTKTAGTDELVAAVFVRRRSTSPWLLTEAPRLAGSTDVGAVAQQADGSAVTLASETGQWSDGRTPARGFPQRLVDDYAATLTDPDGPEAAAFVKDSFISQMRTLAEAQPVENVTFAQHWSAMPVRHAIRLSDGGALVFATLERTDRYTVKRRRSLSFAGLQAAAYFPTPVTRSATLNYRHQVLMLVPAEGKPLVIGQYGGLVSARGS